MSIGRLMFECSQGMPHSASAVSERRVCYMLSEHQVVYSYSWQERGFSIRLECMPYVYNNNNKRAQRSLCQASQPERPGVARDGKGGHPGIEGAVRPAQ